jgi:uncharacterized damage-inducible protein DinB
MNDKIKNLYQTLKLSIDIISGYIKSIPEELIDKRRKEDFWTVKQHVMHLLNTQSLLFDRLNKFKNDDYPVIVPYFPENDAIKETDLSINDLLDQFIVIRNKQLELIDSFTERDLKKEGSHDEYLKYNIEILLNHILFHDYWHMYRIEELWLTKDKYL